MFRGDGQKKNRMKCFCGQTSDEKLLARWAKMRGGLDPSSREFYFHCHAKEKFRPVPFSAKGAYCLGHFNFLPHSRLDNDLAS